jgi:hypothetical protein
MNTGRKEQRQKKWDRQQVKVKIKKEDEGEMKGVMKCGQKEEK